MGKLNIEFMDDSVGFTSMSEDILEKKVLDAVNNHTDVSEWDQEIWDCLTDHRRGLLDWYSFSDNASILEVGSGFGTISVLLSEIADRLICVEKKSSRCNIVRARLKDRDNVTVINENIKDCRFEEKFDYIIIHNVSGYLLKYYGSKNALCEFLSQMRDILSEGGKLIFAIENRLGLKFFSGAIEDYSGKFFVGLNSFDGYNAIRTYTRFEIEKGAAEAGFNHYRFYYPFPDIDYPTDIYTDDILSEIPYEGISESINTNRLYFFNEPRLWRLLNKEKVVTEFVNAFIVEMSDSDLDDHIVYNHRNSAGRYAGFSLTYMKDGRMVYNYDDKSISFDKPLGKRMDIVLKDYLDSVTLEDDKRIKAIVTDLWMKLFSNIDELIDDAIKLIGSDKAIFGVKDLYFYNDGFTVVSAIESGELYDKEQIKWHMFLEWYNEEIRRCSDFEKLVDYQRITEQIKTQRITPYVHYDSVKKHYLPKFMSNLIYPIDGIMNGDAIVNEIDEECLTESMKHVVEEQNMLNRIR